MNDALFQLDGVMMEARLGTQRLGRLSLPMILRMGQELYAGEPALQRRAPQRAQRLGALISGKAPTVNAALFMVPRPFCAPDEVAVRVVACEFELMAELYMLEREGLLDAAAAYRRVWRRLPAASV